MAKLTATSLKRLAGVHPHLVALVHRALEISTVPFQITEGARSVARQRELVKTGASRTMNSRHIVAPNGLAHAVDVVAMVGSRVSWETPLYYRIADAFKRASREMGTPVTWGGDWKSFFDGPHFELPWADYPGIEKAGDPAPPAPLERDLATLVPGSKGSAVRTLQTHLNALGADLDVDGDYAALTRAAVLARSEALTGKATDRVTASLAETFRKAAAKAGR